MEKIIPFLTSGDLLNIDGKGYLPDIILPILGHYDYLFINSREKYYELMDSIPSLNKELVILYSTGDVQLELKMILTLWQELKPTFNKENGERDSKLLILGYSNLLEELENFDSFFLSLPQFPLEVSFGWVKIPSVEQIQLRIDQLDEDTVIVLPEEFKSKIKTGKKIVNRWDNLENYSKILDCNVDRWGSWLSLDNIFSLQFSLARNQTTTIYYLMDKQTFELLPLNSNFSDSDINLMMYQFYSLEYNIGLLGFDYQKFESLKLPLNLPNFLFNWDLVALKFLTLCATEELQLLGCILSEPSFFVGNRKFYLDFMDTDYNKTLLRTSKIILDELGNNAEDSIVEQWASQNKISILPIKQAYSKFKQLRQFSIKTKALELTEIIELLAEYYPDNIYQYQSKKQVYINNKENNWFNTTINLTTGNKPENIIYLINNHPLVIDL